MYIVVDIGGTKTRVAGSSDLETFSEPLIFPTPQKYEDGIAAIIEAAQGLSGAEKIKAVAMGMSGVILRDKRSMFSSNLPAWDSHPIADDIEQALAASVHLENDTALVGLGEAVFGAGIGCSPVMYMTVSTGVNAVRIVNDVVDQGVYGSETGEQYVFADGKPQQLGDIISGTAIAEKYGMHPQELGKDSPVWEELAHLTAFGVYNSIVHWSPERVVLGGSMFNEIGISVDRVAAHVHEINSKYPTLPEIVHAKLGDVGGLWGGIARLRQVFGEVKPI